MTEPWVSVEAIAEPLGVRWDSTYRWIDSKGLTAHRIGRLWKFKVSEVDDWVRSDGARDEDTRTRDGSYSLAPPTSAQPHVSCPRCSIDKARG